jgi:hypothetical protein
MCALDASGTEISKGTVDIYFSNMQFTLTESSFDQ